MADKIKWAFVMGVADGDQLKYSINIAPDFMSLDDTKFSWGLPLSWKFETCEEADIWAEKVNEFLDQMVVSLNEDSLAFQHWKPSSVL